jgi:hypothetical protein
MRTTSGFILILLSCAAMVPERAPAQGVTLTLYPRAVVEDSARLAAALPAGKRLVDLSDSQKVVAVARIDTAVQTLRSWRSLTDSAASTLWQTKPIALLPAANLTPGTDRAEIYTELAHALTGGWRVVLGTALAVEGGAAADGDPNTAQEPSETTDGATGFRRFLAGGGNLSLTAMRPMAMRSRTYHSEVLVALPRLLANIPSLSATDGVDDFGAELAAEYQYLRYARHVLADGSLSETPQVPFLAASLRSGVVFGTNAFYRTMDRGNKSGFLYLVPKLNLQFDNGVKFGAAYFYGFGTFKEHEALTFQITIAPTKAAR